MYLRSNIFGELFALEVAGPIVRRSGFLLSVQFDSGSTMFTYPFLMALLLQVARTQSNSKPHIVIIMADDLGWNDVSFHGSDQITTPNIDALAYNGIILNSHYVPALCTPSRASLLTGKYPTTTGMQHLVILAPEPWGLPLSERLMPEYLRDAGYRTHAVGKWHLGFYRKEYTPTYRGFDQHYGYWNGFHDYYDHSMKATYAPYKGYDMRRNMTTDWSAIGKYTTDLFTNEAVDVIRAHDPSKAPLFMYVAHLAPHTGNDNDPFQAPDEEIAKFGHIEDPERRVYAAMVSKVDQSVGEIMTALRTKGMLDNSIVLFLSDNGAPTLGVHSNRGSNWPLRGMKNTPMEGGVRGVGAIWSPLLNSTQRVSNQLMHVSDWLPTFYTAAGLNVKDLGRIDGIDMWAALSENLPSPRVEVLHNIDDIANYSSVRNGDWKYTSGSVDDGKSEWYGESGIEDSKDSFATPKYDVDSVLRSPTGTAILGLVTKLQIKEKEDRFVKIIENDSRQDIQKRTQLKLGGRRRLLSRSMITTLRQQAQISCQPLNRTASNSTTCRALDAPCLFNIHSDPCETTNLAAIHPLVVARLEAILLRLRRTTAAPLNVPSDPAANPVNWDGVWTSWLDEVEKELPPGNATPPFSPVLILTILASLFGIIIFVLMAIILRIYLCRMPESCSLISLFLFKDSEGEDSAKHKTVE